MKHKFYNKTEIILWEILSCLKENQGKLTYKGNKYWQGIAKIKCPKWNKDKIE